MNKKELKKQNEILMMKNKSLSYLLHAAPISTDADSENNETCNGFDERERILAAYDKASDKITYEAVYLAVMQVLEEEKTDVLEKMDKLSKRIKKVEKKLAILENKVDDVENVVVPIMGGIMCKNPSILLKDLRRIVKKRVEKDLKKMSETANFFLSDYKNRKE